MKLATVFLNLLALLVMAGTAWAQEEQTRDNQLWFDYDPTWRLGRRWTFDADAGLRFINSAPSLWQIRLQPTLQFSPLKWMDLTGGVWLIYTNQVETFDLFETRPVVGIRFKRDIWRGARLSNYFRAEYRIQRNLETGETLSAGRLRNRIQAMIPINHRSLSEDNTWYAFVDVEWFWQRDTQVNDGFNSRRRYRAGIAWRKNSTWTYEIFYGFQRTRSSADAAFSTAADIFNFTLIQTFK